MMAKYKKMTPLSGQPNRFSFHMEINVKTAKITAGTVISRCLNALNVISVAVAAWKESMAFWKV
jgi:hypothetical protein